MKATFEFTGDLSDFPSQLYAGKKVKETAWVETCAFFGGVSNAFPNGATVEVKITVKPATATK